MQFPGVEALMEPFRNSPETHKENLGDPLKPSFKNFLKIAIDIFSRCVRPFLIHT